MTAACLCENPKGVFRRKGLFEISDFFWTVETLRDTRRVSTQEPLVAFNRSGMLHQGFQARISTPPLVFAALAALSMASSAGLSLASCPADVREAFCGLLVGDCA